jgi:adenylosuccinate synthase
VKALAVDDDVRALLDDAIADRWLEQACWLARQVVPAGEAVVAARLAREGTLLFEGAQGMLLDEARASTRTPRGAT